jgi:hypothetical protein
MAMVPLSITVTGMVHSRAARSADSYVADIDEERVATTISVAPATWAARKAWRNLSGDGREVETGCIDVSALATCCA